MPDTTFSADDATPHGHGEATENEVIRILDHWKARVDQLRVQVDLAKLDFRDEAAKQLDLARSANEAASSKLRDAYHDAAVTAEMLRDGVHEFLHDVKEAFEAVQAEVSRD